VFRSLNPFCKTYLHATSLYPSGQLFFLGEKMSEPYSRIEYIQTQPVDWTYAPTKLEVEEYYLSATFQDAVTKESFYYPGFRIRPEDCLDHKIKSTDGVINLYESNGFETRHIVEDPFGHPGPTVSCPIGFPFNLPKDYPELRRYSRWICRVHADVCTVEEGILVSVPHIEPDPVFHSIAHFWDSYIKGNVVRGPVAVEVLKTFLHLGP
jgi:hypothetical protein